MSAKILDGKISATALKLDLKHRIASHQAQGLRAPALAVILVGDDHASSIYVAHKKKACEDVGIQSHSYHLASDTSEQALRQLIDKLNHSDQIDGILVQLPLPNAINTRAIIEQISPNKDVDGFHPYNLGCLAQGYPTLRPCTPYGIMQLLAHYQLKVHGKNAVIIGASNIVGKPMAFELLLAKATVTLCHRATHRLAHHVNHADLIVVAAGSMDVVKPEWLHQEQILIDVGIHRDAGTQQIRGDVDFVQAVNRVAWITPVPGGVGPMTVATLLQNTLTAFERQIA